MGSKINLDFVKLTLDEIEVYDVEKHHIRQYSQREMPHIPCKQIIAACEDGVISGLSAFNCVEKP